MKQKRLDRSPATVAHLALSLLRAASKANQVRIKTRPETVLNRSTVAPRFTCFRI